MSSCSWSHWSPCIVGQTRWRVRGVGNRRSTSSWKRAKTGFWYLESSEYGFWKLANFARWSVLQDEKYLPNVRSATSILRDVGDLSRTTQRSIRGYIFDLFARNLSHREWMTCVNVYIDCLECQAVHGGYDYQRWFVVREARRYCNWCKSFVCHPCSLTRDEWSPSFLDHRRDNHRHATRASHPTARYRLVIDFSYFEQTVTRLMFHERKRHSITKNRRGGLSFVSFEVV